jgi:hypothetical protein
MRVAPSACHASHHAHRAQTLEFGGGDADRGENCFGMRAKLRAVMVQGRSSMR